MHATSYDPFAPGGHAVGVRTTQARDAERDRLFPCELWYPAQGDEPGELRDAAPLAGPHPLVIFSHHSGGNRRSSSFLCAHLASHGYVVAALDHSEVVAPELGRPADETPAGHAALVDAIIASRVPDVRFLLDFLLGGRVPDLRLDPARIGLAGHSFGGWTALAVPEADARAGAVVAMAPGGTPRPRPGVLPLTLTFARHREVPVLYLAAENDVPISLDGLRELHRATPPPSRMFILARADHQHFLDDVAGRHEAVRAAQFPPEAAWIPAAMRPAAELCPAEHAHLFTRGLALAHLDATLRDCAAARQFLASDVEAELAARGVTGTAR